MSTYLGIDIGGTSAKYGVATSQGEMQERGSFPTGYHCTKEYLWEAVMRVIDDALQYGIKGIGICTLGAVDSKVGEIFGATYNLPALNGLKFKSVLEDKYGLPVCVKNDANAAARCEYWLGAGKGCKSFFHITFGTGLGGGFFLNGDVHEGAHFQGGEISYLDYVSEDSCLEKEVSTISVMQRAAHAIGVDQLDGPEFFRLAQDGNPIMLNILDTWMQKVARLIANIIVVLDPEKVLIGGGISSQQDILLPRLRPIVNGMLPKEFRKHAVIEATQYGNDAGILGTISYFVIPPGTA